MPVVKFVLPSGGVCAARVKSGTTVMEAAVANGVVGIEAQCYGACVCGTCHVYIEASWAERAGRGSDWEAEVLATLPLARSDSRLSCQIAMRDELSGLVVLLPEFQGLGDDVSSVGPQAPEAV
jgi:ferredoxin, 2Fe-2S